MQLRRRRFAVVAITALTLVVACGKQNDNLGPTAPIWQALAFHFDTIYNSLDSIGTTQDSLYADVVALGGETPPGFGGKPSTVAVTTTGGSATWQGVTYEVVIAGADSSFLTFLYSNPSLSEVVLAETDYDGGPSPTGTALFILNLSTSGTDTAYTGSATIGSTGNAGSCSLLSIPNAYAYIDSVLTASLGAFNCQPATFQISFQAAFPAADSAGALSTVSISSTPFTGVRLFGPGNGGSRITTIPSRTAALVQRITARMAKLHQPR
jgi:hypothetical protein